MRKLNNKTVSITVLIILISVASTTFYAVFRNLPYKLGSFALLWAPLSLIFIFFDLPRSYYKGKIRWLIFYGLISVLALQYTLWKYMSEWNRIRIVYEFFYLFTFFVIWNYFRIKRNNLSLGLITKWTFIFILFTLVTTNIALFLDSGIVRNSANTAEFTTVQTNIFNYSGSMDYGYAQAVICLIPILVYFLRKKNSTFNRRIILGTLILIVISEMRSMVFANILVTLIILTISLISPKKRTSLMVTASLLIILLIAVPESFFADSLRDLSNHFEPKSVVNRKLVSMADFIQNPDIDAKSDIGGRASRYPLLFKALSENPLLGYASHGNNISISGGAHLYWMNRLTIWGIPGFILFILVLYKIFRQIGSYFNSEYRFYYFLSVFAFILLGFMKAIGGREIWLVLILLNPGLYFLSVPASVNNNKEQSDTSFSQEHLSIGTEK